MRGGIEDDKGTYYLGEGAWGTDVNMDCSLTSETNATFQYEDPKNHFWLIEIDPTNGTGVATYSAYSSINGEKLIDDFYQNF